MGVLSTPHIAPQVTIAGGRNSTRSLLSHLAWGDLSVSNMDNSSYLLAPLPRCSILIDRHIQKNAGSTMRRILLENSLVDDWEYWGYGMGSIIQVAHAIERALLTEVDGSSCASWHRWATRAPLRILGELHYGGISGVNRKAGIQETLLKHFGPASRLQQVVMRCACKVVLVTRLREPSSFYPSFWKWAGIDRKQRHNSSKFGATMLEWAQGCLNGPVMLWFPTVPTPPQRSA